MYVGYVWEYHFCRIQNQFYDKKELENDLKIILKVPKIDDFFQTYELIWCELKLGIADFFKCSTFKPLVFVVDWRLLKVAMNIHSGKWKT